MATACLRFFTTGPPLPLCKPLFLYSRMTCETTVSFEFPVIGIKKSKAMPGVRPRTAFDFSTSNKKNARAKSLPHERINSKPKTTFVLCQRFSKIQFPTESQRSQSLLVFSAERKPKSLRLLFLKFISVRCSATAANRPNHVRIALQTVIGNQRVVVHFMSAMNRS